jgi:hypothetical protein
MSVALLKHVSDMMNALNIPYAFMRWNVHPPDDYYFVGEYTESEMVTKEEDGRQDTTFILRGFTRKDWLLLEEAKEKIEKSCNKTAILPDGSGIAVFYEYGMVVPTYDAELKSIKINLQIQEWKVN